MLKNIQYKIKYVNFIVVIILVLLPINSFADSPIKVHVSILPQQYFVEKIGKDKVIVDVMVKPGKSPATYAPLPDQIKKLGMSDIYFKIGVPFETTILHKIKSINNTIIIIDTNKDVVLRNIKNHNHATTSDHDNYNIAGKDPHTWMNPLIVKKQAYTILQALLKISPNMGITTKQELNRNYTEFIMELDKLDKKLKTILKKVKTKTIFVFHPFMGYFADAYGLQQIAIETMGKTPKAKDLSRIIKLAKKENIKKIFVQSQFDKNAATKIASAINGSVISIDPLAYDYINNMKKIAETIVR